MLTPILPQVIDATQISCFRGCPQKFYNEFVLGARPPGLSIDLHAGACFAGALEETYRGIYQRKLTLSEALLRAHAKFLLDWGDFEIPEHKYTAKRMDRVWEAVVGDGTPEGRGYFEEYPPLSDDILPYIADDGQPTFEYTFAIPLEPLSVTEAGDGFPRHPDTGEPFLYCGRFDMLGQTRDGRIMPRDEKTSGQTATVDWARKWQLRSQFMGYVWALQQCGLDVDSVCVRGISILKTKIGHSQHIQSFSRDLISRWHNQLRRDLWHIRRSWDEGYFDYNFAETCTSYGNCVFMDACTSAHPEMWLDTMSVRRWNPLHKNPAASANPELKNAV